MTVCCLRICRGLLALALLNGEMCGAVAAEAGSSSQDFVVHSWGGEQGLPQNEVRAITQAPDGYLWVGTFGGLARFDGNRFEVFSIANTPGLPNNLINALFCDRLGRLWIGHDTGHVTVFKDHKCSQIPMPADWLRTPIRSFGQDAKGNIWVLNALWQLAIIDDSGKLLPAPQVPPPDYALHFAAALSDESLRVVTQTGRCYLALPQGLRPDPDQPPVPSDGGRLIRSSLGGYWALSENHLARWLGGQQVEDAGTVRWGEELFGSTCEWKGNIASGTFRNGLYLAGRDGSRIHLDTSSGFPSDRICALFVDKDNVLWVGTGDGGLTGIWPRRVTVINPPGNAGNNRYIRSVSPIRDGGVWVATETAGAYRFSNGRWVRSPSLHEGHLPIFSAMDVGPDGRVWATAAGGGLYYLQEPRWHLHKPFSRLARGVLLAQTNALWVPDYESLLRFSGPEFSQIDRLPNCAGVCCLAEDGSGGLWYSGYGVGLGHWRPQGTTLLHAINGLPSENLISLFKASDGNLWIGTDGSGLLRLHNGHFSVITKRQGLPSDTICQLIEDNAGRLWMGTYAGICAVTLQDLNRCADQSLPKIKCLVLDEADGLESKECSAGNQPAVCRTADGRLWFATKSGVVVVTPSLISINTNSLPVWIEQVNTDTEAVTLARSEEQLTLPLGERRFRITFDVPCLRAAHRVRFMHKLEPLDTQWVEAGTSREVTYTHVPPGHYSFKVIASNEDGVWNSRPASLVLFIQPFLWERPAFQASLGLLLLVASLGGVWQLGRLRTRRRILQFQQQQLVERERARIARDMHDDLGSRLTKAAMLTESVVQEPRLPEQSRQRAVLLRDTITEMTNSMDELVWAVNPRHDTFDGLANYLLRYAQEYLANTSIECQLDLPLTFPSVTIHSSLRHNLFLAFKEALRNAVRHAQARRVHIGLRLDAGIMCLDVADDGGGFAPEMVHSRGLQNMRDRLALLGGACRVESAPGKGTRIRFEVPLSSRLLTCGTAD